MQPSAAQKVVLADQAGDAEDDAGLLSVGEAPFSALIASLLALLRSPSPDQVGRCMNIPAATKSWIGHDHLGSDRIMNRCTNISVATKS